MTLHRTARASKAAARAYEPFLLATTRRFGPIPAGFWRRKYSSGFIVTLITLHSRAGLERDGAQATDAVGNIQLDAFERLTGQPSEGLGELVYLASIEQDRAFLEGCENAVVFFRAWQVQHDAQRHMTPGDGEQLRELARFNDSELAEWAGPECVELWRQFFDDRIAA